MALGAQPGDVVRLVVRQGRGLDVMAGPRGVVAAFAVGRTMSSLLFGVSPADATAFIDRAGAGVRRRSRRVHHPGDPRRLAGSGRRSSGRLIIRRTVVRYDRAL